MIATVSTSVSGNKAYIDNHSLIFPLLIPSSAYALPAGMLKIWVLAGPVFIGLLQFSIDQGYWASES